MPAPPPSPAAVEALSRLKEGNRRFVSEHSSRETQSLAALRETLTGGQRPGALVLGCADSRVPPEMIFDQTLGELFVVRVAGNVARATQVGSVEFGVAVLGIPLVVVLGHSDCGAVDAALREVMQPGGVHHSNLRTLLELVQPAVEPVVRAMPDAALPELMEPAVRANVAQAVKDLRTGSPYLEEQVSRGELLVVGAEYDLESGRVIFLDDPTEAGEAAGD